MQQQRAIKKITTAATKHTSAPRKNTTLPAEEGEDD